MKILIIGTGSIASKHVNAIKSIDNKCSFYALRHDTKSIHHDDIHSLYNWKDIPKDLEFAIVLILVHQLAWVNLNSLECKYLFFRVEPKYCRMQANLLV